MESISRRDTVKGVALACGAAMAATMGLGIAPARGDEAETMGLGIAPARGDEAETGQDLEATETGGLPAGAIEAGGFTMIPYTHYASGGVASELYACILFENSNSTFTKYQIAFTSCTCRDAASNYRSVMYVEMLNTKDTPEEATLRWVTFGEDGGYSVGLWGDSDPVHGRPDYTASYMEETFVADLVKRSKAEFDAWGGYGEQLEGADVDAVAGATVSTSNIISVLRSLFAYHAAKYYR